MMDWEQPEIRFAIDAVRRASLLVQHIQKRMMTASLTKTDRSPVTVADFASQALVGKLLKETFPQDVLVAEEDSGALQVSANRLLLDSVVEFLNERIPEATPEKVCTWIDYGAGDSSSRFWTLDPIDGTKGFLRGDQYVVALALVAEGVVRVGVLGCPNLSGGYRADIYGEGSLVVAARGQGTWVMSLREDEVSPKRLNVSTQSDLAQARLLRSFESGHTNVGQIDSFIQELGITASPVRMDSQAKYAVLASGHAELYLRLLSADRPNYREKIWDQAAGSIIVEEAGGKVTDLNGKPLDFGAGRTLATNLGVCASNGLMHAAAIEALRKIQYL